MASDVADNFLYDAINLHLCGAREAQTLVQIIVRNELILELTLKGRVRDGVGERPFERRAETDVLQNRRTQVFADAPNLVRDRLYLCAEDGGRSLLLQAVSVRG